jgi:hypothetical protein
MEFGDIHTYEWINKRCIKGSREKGTFTISFFHSGWRFLRSGKIFFGNSDYFEDNERLYKIAEQEMENVIDILLIEKMNKYDYRLHFSENIILETFELVEDGDDPPLYLTDKENKAVLDINLLCDYMEAHPNNSSDSKSEMRSRPKGMPDSIDGIDRDASESRGDRHAHGKNNEWGINEDGTAHDGNTGRVPKDATDFLREKGFTIPEDRYPLPNPSQEDN